MNAIFRENNLLAEKLIFLRAFWNTLNDGRLNTNIQQKVSYNKNRVTIRLSNELLIFKVSKNNNKEIEDNKDM